MVVADQAAAADVDPAADEDQVVLVAAVVDVAPAADEDPVVLVAAVVDVAQEALTAAVDVAQEAQVENAVVVDLVMRMKTQVSSNVS